MRNAIVPLLLVAAATAVTNRAAAQAPLPGEREAVITAIPGVVAAGAEWRIVWADFVTADGIVGTADGGVLFAQEQTDTIRKLDASGVEHVMRQSAAWKVRERCLPCCSNCLELLPISAKSMAWV